ncbi:hypothetical protein SDRG_11135 [Saprolegnia diclina VS20]|uniref:Uncharacterized protein n=1 Tax=Saprolegnia diclina (strain VS20) TaxID=1156394 RepID=T0Q1A7_SAPDV|nr:hypothetical protein SDRG_11135 [Saprolegnia diclina VS20]XP_008619441.1 hypothetical protein SDRG_15057 [Saprolegnia diclina VS20]EQC27155.1 hypothetical protein SDRG_15057 [Saprolegnia diclina VS20]EQC31212.1 hypothetical protein SDRG_11135 [Saprolegnia diclina VS20]|eukprot:XP_008615385.1 hypothetical protein SDRG_11135 [Saprolegnia diclina VS20]
MAPTTTTLGRSVSVSEEYEIDQNLLARYERLNMELEQMARLQRSRQRNHSWDNLESTKAGGSSRGVFSARVPSNYGSSRGFNTSFRGPSASATTPTGTTRGTLFSSQRSTGLFPSTRGGKIDIPAPYEEEWVALSKELEKARKDCIEKRATQAELLAKMEKIENSALRRFFGFNKEKRMEKLRLKLCKQLSDAEAADNTLHKLERRSMSLTELQIQSLKPRSTGGQLPSTSMSLLPVPMDDLDVELMERQELLEQEKRDILNNVFNAFVVPDVHRLKAHIAVAASEVKASDAIQKQVEDIYKQYRQAFGLLRAALATIVGNEYSHTMKEFILGPYPLAIEAGRLVESAALQIQPEAKRKYPDFAPLLATLQLPKFPTTLKDLARPGALLTTPDTLNDGGETDRRLKRAENVIVKTQQIVARNLELLEQWRSVLEKDRTLADKTCAALESQLEKKMATLVHSMTTSSSAA